MADSTVPMNDAELMESAMAPEPQQEAPAPAPEVNAEEKTEDRPRDEQGRFVAKEAEKPAAEAPPAPQPVETKDDAHVPSWRLREVREAREAAERRAEEASRQAFTFQQQMAEMQRRLDAVQKPKPEPVDFFQNPDEAFQQRLSPIEERIQSAEQRLLMRASRAEAVAEHGKAAVAEMEAAVQKAMQSNHPGMMALSAQMRASEHPVGVAMDWYRQNSLYERTGGDLDAYVQKQLDAKLKDPEFLAKAMEAARGQAQTRPNVQLPPSLHRATGAGVSDDDVEKADMSDASLIRYATAKGGR